MVGEAKSDYQNLTLVRPIQDQVDTQLPGFGRTAWPDSGFGSPDMR